MIISMKKACDYLGMTKWQLRWNRYGLTEYRTPSGHRRFDLSEILQLKTQLDCLTNGIGVLPVVAVKQK